jgi:hypothetical protein
MAAAQYVSPGQRTGSKLHDRKDHVWTFRKRDYLCVLCGAVCNVPPPYPTPDGWLPDHYEALTPAARSLSPPTCLGV